MGWRAQPRPPQPARVAVKPVPLKPDPTDPTPQPGETEREAKIRALAAKVRADAKARASGAVVQGRPVQGQSQAAIKVDPKKEVEDGKKLDLLLPALEQKISTAEDEAEKVSIHAAPLAMEATEELRSLQSGAIKETERAVKAALNIIMTTSRDLEKRVQECELFAPSVRVSANEELGKLSARLDAAKAKVEEHRHVRRDHEQALAAEKLFDELAMRLSSVEVDCEKAAMMAEPLTKGLSVDFNAVNTAEIRETKEALRIAQTTLAPTMRLITGKVENLKGPIKKKMQELQDRAEAAQSILDKAHQTVEEAQSRAAAEPILRGASERIEKVEEILMEMRETEAPFLMGIEVMPADESGEVLQKMDKAATKAQSTLADALKFINLKLVEVGRLAEGASIQARKELEKAKAQVEEGFDRIKAFMEESASRRRQNMVALVHEKIEEAEAAVLKMKESGADLPNLEPSNLPEALEHSLALELEAQNLVTVARREMQEKQQELRPQPGANQDTFRNNSDLMRTKTRITYLETELTKFRKQAKSFEEKIKVGKSLHDTSNMLQQAETEVDTLVDLAAAWSKEDQIPDTAGKQISDVQAKLSSATMQVEMRLQTAQGLELKELRGIFGRLQKTQNKLDSVKDGVRSRTKAASQQILLKALDAVRTAEAKIATVSSTAASDDLPAERLEDLYQQAMQGLSLTGVAQRTLDEGQNGPLALESKVEFARLMLRWKALDRKGKVCANTVSNKYNRLISEAEKAALASLRSAARQEDGSYDCEVLFKKLSSGRDEISEQQFCDVISQTDPMPLDRAKLAFKHLAPFGLNLRKFTSVLADYHTVSKTIVLTDEFDIPTAKKIRKLELGEYVEATSAPKTDTSLGLERVRCRVLKDGSVGWVTLKSAGGTIYLESVKQPMLWIAKNTSARADIKADSKLVKKLQEGDVVELVEGPKEERLGSDMRVRGVACHEEAVGWLQVKDSHGGILARASQNIHKCAEAIAMTDVADLSNCTMIRRIDAGESLELIDTEKAVTPLEGGTRCKFRACRDGREGWITTIGSEGMEYLRHTKQKHYVVEQASPMHAGLGAETEVVRVLMPGEAFLAFEDPREVSGGECLTYYKIRSSKDGVTGWVTSTLSKEVQPWTTQYKVLRTVPLTNTLSTNEAIEPVEVLRMLDANEIVAVNEYPVEDVASGMLRARCVTENDKLVGWVSVRDASGMLMRPAAQEDLNISIDVAAPSTPPCPPPSWSLRGAKEEVKEENVERPWMQQRGQRGKGGKGKSKGKW